MTKPMHATLWIIGLLSFIVVLGSSISGDDTTEKASVSAITTDEPAYNLPQNIRSIPLIQGISWAGEPVPVNPDTKERLDRELSVNAYWQSSTLLNIKNANKHFPTIERILAEEGVPDDFKYLAVAESNLRNVTSSAAAKGFWQFRKLAAKEWNLEVNSEVDERYHVEKATRAAARYLKHMHNRFGSWTNAAAAYNVGPTKFSRLLRTQKVDSYYDLHLNNETARYVFRLIAMKEILQNPGGFGFDVPATELYQPEDSYKVEITSSVASWPDWAQQHGVSYRLLKYYNPWLIDTKLTVKKNKYFVELPKP